MVSSIVKTVNTVPITPKAAFRAVPKALAAPASIAKVPRILSMPFSSLSNCCGDAAISAFNSLQPSVIPTKLAC